MSLSQLLNIIKSEQDDENLIIKRYPENVFSILFSLLTLILLINLVILTPVTKLHNGIGESLDKLSEIITKFSYYATTNSVLILLVAIPCLYFLFIRRIRLALKILSAGMVSYVFTIILSLLLKSFKPSLEAINENITLVFASTFSSVVTAIYFVLSSQLRGVRNKSLLYFYYLLIVLRVLSLREPFFSIVIGIAAGWFIASCHHLIFGIETRNKKPSQILQVLQKLGYQAEWLKKISADARGSVPYIVNLADGSKLFVKVVSKEHLDADSLFKIWRKVIYRNTEFEVRFLSVTQKIEHEGFLSVLAAKAGVKTPEILGTASDTEGNGYLIYQFIEGNGLDEKEDVDGSIIKNIFEQIKLLQIGRIAHRDLRLANVFQKKNGEAMLMDFGFAESFASNELLARDLVEIFVSLALVSSTEKVAKSASEIFDKNLITLSLKFLQSAALSTATREALNESPNLLGDLKNDLIKYSQVSEPETVTITRFDMKRLSRFVILTLLIIPLFVWSDFINSMVTSHKILSIVSILITVSIYLFWYFYLNSFEIDRPSILKRFRKKIGLK